MPKILAKYLIREHIGPFFLALLVINSIFTINLLFRDLNKFLSKGISLPVILEFLFLNLAWMIALSVPMAVLAATIMAFGRLSADNEIMALKASGIGIHQVLPFILIISSLLAGALIWFNNHVLPDFNHRARLLALDIARKKPMINLDPGIIYTEIANYSILVQEIEEQDLVSFVKDVIIDDETESDLIKTINADHGELYFNPKTELLEITLFNGELQEINIHKPESFKRVAFLKHVIKIPMSETILQRSQSSYRGDREKSAGQLLENVAQNRKKIKERKQRLNEEVMKHVTNYTSSTVELQHLQKSLISKRQNLKGLVIEQQKLKRKIETNLNMIKSYEKSTNIFLVEVHKKYSIPTACIVFVFIGAPVAMLIRQRGWAIAAGLSIGFFLLYWAFLIGGEILADRQKITPFMAMWAPNILVGGIGIFLMVRVILEFSPINFKFLSRKS